MNDFNESFIENQTLSHGLLWSKLNYVVSWERLNRSSALLQFLT